MSLPRCFMFVKTVKKEVRVKIFASFQYTSDENQREEEVYYISIKGIT